MIKFLARLCCRSGASMGQFLARLCCRVGASMGQFLARLWGSFWLVYGADFGSTVSTWCVYVARSKKFLACVCLNAPYPLCAFKNGLRHKRAQTITSTWVIAPHDHGNYTIMGCFFFGGGGSIMARTANTNRKIFVKLPLLNTDNCKTKKQLFYQRRNIPILQSTVSNFGQG